MAATTPFLRALRVASTLLCSSLASLSAAIDEPVTPNALPEVRSLLVFMDSLRGKQILSGQFELPAWNGTQPSEIADQETEMNFLLAQTGKLPAIRGFDFMRHSQALQSQETQRDAERAIQWHRRGGIVTYCHHLAMPAATGGREFYWSTANSKYTTFDIKKAAIEGTAEHTELIQQMDVVAAELKKLNNARVPVLWRPFHECSGGWFWWGRDAEAFKTVWRMVFKRYTEVHKLTNLIWVFNPTEGNGAAGLTSNLTNWYPGDEYVDMISADYYATEADRTFAWVYKGLYDFRTGRKGVWMSENGPLPDPDKIFAAGAEWTAFVTWYRDFITDGKTNSIDYLKKVYQHEKVITLDELPALWSTQPSFILQPVGGEALTGAKVVLSGEALGSGPLTYQWYKDGVFLPGATEARYVIAATTSGSAGVYTLRVSNGQGVSVTSQAASLTVSGKAFSPRAAYLYNLSSRAKVGGANNLVVGFAIRGAGSKRLLIRAAGPKLSELGIPTGYLGDPYLEVHDLSNTVVAKSVNQDWWLNQRDLLNSAFSSAGAFSFNANANDAAIIVDLPAGNYSATARGHLNKQGISLVELYDLDENASTYLANLSTLPFVGTGSEQLAAGFTVRGEGSLPILLRASGPTLARVFAYPSAVIEDPTMTLFKVISSTENQVVATNDDWALAANRADVTAATVSLGLKWGPREEDKDPILLSTLTKGSYSTEISGKNNGTGAMIMEIYLPE